MYISALSKVLNQYVVFRVIYHKNIIMMTVGIKLGKNIESRLHHLSKEQIK